MARWQVMAFASIYVPNFIVQAAVCARTEWKNRAVALLDGTPPLLSVAAMNEFAERAGIQVGMSESQVRQFNGVEVERRSREREEAVHGALMEMSWSVSPRVEDTAMETITLDLAGLDSVFGAPERIGKLLARRAATLGLKVHVGISENVETAIHAAKGFSGITVIPGGTEASALASLPMSVLSPSTEVAESLERWGVRKCAELAALPMAELSERLGEEGVRLHELARGARSRSLVLTERKMDFTEEIELDDDVEELEPLAFLLGRLLDQLCARLRACALAASAIHLRFELGDAFEKEPVGPIEIPAAEAPRTYEKDLRLPVPTRDSKLLLNLLRLQLQGDPPHASIRKIALSAEAARRRAAQKQFFEPHSVDTEKFELTLARLENLAGKSNVGAPQILDTHRPGAIGMERFSTHKEETKSQRRATDAGAAQDAENLAAKTALALRVFRPEWMARVEMRDEFPARIYFRGLRGEIAAASGPWRSSGDWWREDAWRQDEWDVEIHFQAEIFRGEERQREMNDGVYRIYYDCARQNWYVRGRYD